MASTSETGHAKNVANFEQMITYVKSYGKTYVPTQAAIKTTALDTLKSSASTNMSAMNNADQVLGKAENARDIAFKPLNALTTKIVGALDSSGATDNIVKDARTLVRKIQGKRAPAGSSPASASTASTSGSATSGTAPATISASQLSYDNRLENFSKLIALLANEPLYIPNETELKTATLTTLAASLKAKNKAVIDATVAANNARIARDKVLYSPTTGLVDIAGEVKEYVKSVYGATAPEYKQVLALTFKKQKQK